MTTPTRWPASPATTAVAWPHSSDEGMAGEAAATTLLSAVRR